MTLELFLTVLAVYVVVCVVILWVCSKLLP